MIGLQMIHKKVGAMLAAAFASLSLIGCGGGGASQTPTVVIKPATDQPAAATSNGTAQQPAGGNTAAPAATGGTGTLVGKVAFSGGAISLPALFGVGAAPKDTAVCGAMSPVPNEKLVVSDGGIENVFIYLEKAPSGVTVEPAESEPAKFDQKNCVFIPHGVMYRVGRTINVLNSDGVAHNTHTLGTRNAQENFLVQPNDQMGVPIKYGRAESLPVKVVCDIHAWMGAFHLVLDHPFGAVTGAGGTFKIENLPAGEHEFVVWHESKGYLNRRLKVAIRGGEETKLDLSFGQADFPAVAGIGEFEGPQPKVLKLSLANRSR